MKPIGSDGRPIPTPPEAHPWRDGLFVVGKYGLRTGVGFLVFGVVTELIANQTWLARDWNQIGLVLLRMAVLSLAGGMVLVAALTLIVMASWPFTATRRGHKLERQIDRLTPECMEEVFDVVRREVAAARDDRMRRGWSDWLAWLQARAAKRRTIGGAPGSWTMGPDPKALLMVGALAALFAGAALWMTVALIGQEPEAWLFLFPTALSGYGAYLFGKVATLRVELTPDRLALYRFWRPLWSASRQTVIVIEDPKAAPAAYRVFDNTTGKTTGMITAAPFRSSDLETLADWFRAPG